MVPPPGSAARYRGRFAPSPTGPLHFGSLVAALASYCDARAAAGEWLVRIEDVDEPRTRPGAADAILRTLEAYGFAWDGAVQVQSSRTSRYEAVLAELRARGEVFRCTCTRRELERAPLSRHGERVYPGTCREGASGGSVSAWRLRVPPPGTMVGFVDRLQGPHQQDLAREVGDFVVKRADGLFAYQLAVVVDDHDQGVTDVVRGADLLSSTPRQIWLQRRLGFAMPRYLHLPVAINAAGEKLSKQTRAPPLAGDPVPALRAVWRFLGQPEAPAAHAPVTLAEFWADAIRAWSPQRLPPVRMLPAAAAAGRQV